MGAKPIDEKAIFNVAISIDNEQARQQYLNQVCGQEPELIERVGVLLRMQDEEPEFLESPALCATSDIEPTIDVLGDVIGPYKLLEVIGEGGMGTVYMAEQTEPVHRRVALKLIKTGMDTRQVVARFEAERQALAVMDHPNIAKVLDAGSTESGHPYFVMELVKGKPITQVCDEQQLDTESRLKLFQQVCHAVQHAHQKGIIHRDIKPSNVLVAMYDDRPVPKVIDFGVAKATGEKLTEKTMFTRFGQIVGTLEYMSPEQAQFNQLDIDTRSDIYSLGAILCELLTGEPPFDGERLKSQALDETLKMIREEEPTKPSTKLHSSAIAAQTASNRRTTTEKLNSMVRGDLDWIVMKALEKDRTRRYETANGLALDIVRHLNDEPVLAGPPNNVYRLRKFARKHKAGVAITIVSLLVLLAGLAGLATSNSQIRAEKNRTSVALDDVKAQRDRVKVALKEANVQRNRAFAAEGKAEARANELKQVSDFQAEMLGQIDPTEAGILLTNDVTEKLAAALTKAGLSEAQRSEQIENFTTLWRRVNATDAARELIDQTILKPAVAAIDKQFADQPLVGARLRHVLAVRYRKLGLYDEALPLNEQAMAIFRRELGEEHPRTLASTFNLGRALLDVGRVNEAEAYYRETLEKQRRIQGDDEPNTLTMINNMAALLFSQGKLSQAEAYDREALEKRRRTLGDDHPHTIGSINHLGATLQAQGKLSDALKFMREALEKSRKVHGAEHPGTLLAYLNVGIILHRQGKLSEAEPYYRKALKKYRRVLGEEHPTTVSSILKMGLLLADQGKLNEAEPYFRQALEKYRRVLGDEHPKTLGSVIALGELISNQGKASEAEPLIRDALAKQRRVLGEDHWETIFSELRLGELLWKQGKFSEAEPYCRRSLDKMRKLLGEEQEDTLIGILNMGEFLFSLGRVTEAEPYFREAMEILRRTRGDEHPITLESIAKMGRLRLEQRKLSEAEPYLREAEATSRRVLGETHPDTLRSIIGLGELLQVQGKYNESVGILVPVKVPASQAFTAGNASTYGELLMTLGEARKGLGEFAVAEANLNEAYSIFVQNNGPYTAKNTKECSGAIIDLYTAWQEAEPDQGYAEKVVEWQVKLDALSQPTTGNDSEHKQQDPQK